MEGLSILFIPAALIVVVAVWWISTSNAFKRAIVKINEAESGIDVALTRRYDTLTKLLDVVKGYAAHETETLTAIVKMRKGMDIKEKGEANRQMDELQSRLNVVAEQYPQLRSAENFRQLQDAIGDVEEHLQAARRVYNMNVSGLNQAIAVFPGSIVAGAQKRSPRAFFEAAEHAKSDVKMTFK